MVTKFSRIAIASLLVLIFLFEAGSVPEQKKTIGSRKKIDKPNIILILTDDLDAKSVSLLPKIKTLLTERGTSFSNFFTGVSVCCPSRASILRGQYAHNHQVLGNTPPTGGFTRFRDQQLERSTLATWLQEAGYFTVLIGKYFNGYPDGNLTYIPQGWTRWYSRVDKSDKDSEDGPESYYNYKLNENGQVVSYGRKPEDYLTDVQSRQAIDSIQQAVKENKPFFIYLSTHAPHNPSIPAPRHIDAFANIKSAPRSPSFNEQDVSDKPQNIRALPPMEQKKIAKIDDRYRKRLQTMLAVDEMVEAIIKVLTSTGRLNNTYIFFTSDNGFQMGEHRIQNGKGTHYEESILVPMIVRGPGVQAGRVVSDLAGNLDLSPTFAELAGAHIPNFVDGRSMMPLLKSSPVNNWRQLFLLERWYPIESRGLRTKNYKYVEYKDGEREFYNLSNDPYELTNTYNSADKELLKELSSRLAGMSNCKEEDCRTIEERPLKK